MGRETHVFVLLLSLLTTVALFSPTQGLSHKSTKASVTSINRKYPTVNTFLGKPTHSFSHKFSSLSMAKDEDLDEVVKESGLEVGLFKSLTSNDKEGNVTPQELLKKYGAAYLTTSITLAIISYATCYVLIDNGVDVGAVLEKVGITVSDQSSTAGTAAIAYAVHKAASPIRFPPTVALTPVVAGILGKSPSEEEDA